MSNVIPLLSDRSDPEGRLAEFGLSTSLIHDAFHPGLSHARNRSSLATRAAAGNDVYQDSFEQLALRLVPLGWLPDEVNGQPRLVHPEGLMALTVASATGVANPNHRVHPRTRPKGPATIASLDSTSTGAVPLDLEEFRAIEVPEALGAPLWFLLYERTDRGLNLSLARPAGRDKAGCIVSWSEKISIASLENDGDLSIFDAPDDGDFDVTVIPRS